MTRKRYKLQLFFPLLLAGCCMAFFPGGGLGQVVGSGSGVRTAMYVLEDKQGTLTLEAAQQASFSPIASMAPNYGLTTSVYWLKLELYNNGPYQHFLLKIHNSTIDHAAFYLPQDKEMQVQLSGAGILLRNRKIKSQYPVFDIRLPRDTVVTCYLRVASNDVMDLPVHIAEDLEILNEISQDQLYFGVYLGIVLIMLLYNLFIYLVVKDSSYVYYVLYILSMGIIQASLKGYTTKFLWQENHWLIQQAHNLSIAFSGICSILFVINFLQVKARRVRIHYLLQVLFLVYMAGIAINICGYFILAQHILQVNAGIVALTIMTCGIQIQRQGFRPALYFNIAWFFFLGSVIIYILKDSGVLPFNSFTNNVILIGSALELTLLSFALADRISLYKKEKEDSQALALEISKENERLIREQNVILEELVNERTEELQVTNEHLNEAMTELKDAQTQLVEAEKMASLGQLTAGIAHEINNPINFVKSNIKPLRLDVNDLLQLIDEYQRLHQLQQPEQIKMKLEQIEAMAQEIDLGLIRGEIIHLIQGIDDGAERTAEIVRGLRTFSRLDESELKTVSIHDGIDSTLVLLRNSMPPYVKVERQFKAEGLIECYPGKLNQVFMNILNNALQSIMAKKDDTNHNYISILTKDETDHIKIHIRDTGIGMTEEVKQRVFEPFFTTKDVGEGTGLGMAIVFKIIGSHHGKINIISEPGEGAEFIITLPRVQPLKY